MTHSLVKAPPWTAPPSRQSSDQDLRKGVRPLLQSPEHKAEEDTKLLSLPVLKAVHAMAHCLIFRAPGACRKDDSCQKLLRCHKYS